MEKGLPKKPLLPPGVKPSRPPPLVIKPLTPSRPRVPTVLNVLKKSEEDFTQSHVISRVKSSTLSGKPALPVKPKRRDVKSMNLEDIKIKPEEKRIDYSPILKNKKLTIEENSIFYNNNDIDNVDKLKIPDKKPITKKVSKEEVFSLKTQLNDFKHIFKPKSNLNKLKSVSSPSLYHSERETFEDESKDEVDGNFFKFKKKDKVTAKHSIDVLKNGDEVIVSNGLKGLRKRAGTAPELLDVNDDENEFSDLHQNEDSQLFDYLLVVTLKEDADKNLIPYISFRFPPKFDDSVKNEDEDQRMNSIPQFCFPDLSLATNNGFKASETFSFVLTDILGGRNFGYCKLINMPTLKYPEVYCIISPYGLFSMYSQILDEVEKQRAFSSTAVFSYLKAVLAHSLPKPTKSITVSFFTKHNPLMEKVTLKRPSDSAIHEHVDLSDLFNALPVRMIIHLLSCLLVESKVLLCANSLSLLSSCCHGLISLMYPFQWQYTYIPVLPNKLIDIVCMPTPFLLGMMNNAIDELDDLPLEQVTIVDLDNQSYIRKEHSKDVLPKQIVDEVAIALDELLLISINELGQSEVQARNQVITEVFIYAYMQLIGHFEQFYEYSEEYEAFKISWRNFYKAATTKDQKKFIKVFGKTQAFQSFTMNRKKNGFSSGLFERRFLEWKSNRESNRLLKSKFKGLLSVFTKKVKT